MWFQFTACGRPGTLVALVFGQWWRWGWGAHVEAKIGVLIIAGWVVLIVERRTRFLALSEGQFLLPTVSAVYLNLNGTYMIQSLFLGLPHRP